MNLNLRDEDMYKEKSKKTNILLYWYIFGVPACLLIFAYIFTILEIPMLIGLSFLIIILYTGMIGIWVIFSNAIISATEK